MSICTPRCEKEKQGLRNQLLDKYNKIEELSQEIVRLQIDKKSPLQLNNNEEAVEFCLILCLDVLLEALQFGDRCRLTKLERIGRRFHQLVDKYFSKMPFLRLDLLLLPGWLNESLSAFIGSEQEMISLANLAAFPQFLRFGEVELCYNKTSLQSIAEKCHTFVDCLQSIQAPLCDSASILVCAEIDKEKPSQFGDYSTLLNHIRGELMPICDSSRQYSFFIDFGSDKTQRVNVIESILTIPQIVRCSNILIEVCQGANPLQLPVKAIAQWLNQTDDRSRIGVIDDQKKQEKFLRIGTEHDKIRNVLEMCKHLTETFKAAQVPTTPFTLMLEFFPGIDGIEEQILGNKKTNEKLSIIKRQEDLEDKKTQVPWIKFFYWYDVLEIKRTRQGKEKELKQASYNS